ncbi:unnamed protein product [Gordionus sp. m RMFG-2023]|uniref:small ribosomal subunit protein uS17m-like n=1 Tax=Gordionus sp. m RMFG-2023 TaxID=3053472 RepID=UPI0030E3B23B
MKTPIYKAYKNLKWVRRKLIWEPWKGKVIEAISQLGVGIGVVGPRDLKTPEIYNVECTKLIMDDFLNMYFDEKETLLAYDPQKMANEGDVVLIKKLDKPYAKDVAFALQEVLYQFGNMIDPISGRKVEGINFRDENEDNKKIHDIIRNTQAKDFTSKGYKFSHMHSID